MIEARRDRKSTHLHIQGLSKSFDGRSVLSRVTFSVAAGSVVGLIGPNGAGKTTLLNVASGFLRADEGSILLGGGDITHLPANRIARKGIGRTFQDVRLIHNLSVLENMLLATPHRTSKSRLSGWGRRCRTAVSWLECVGLSHHQGDRVATLSFGQQKQLSLALAFLVGDQCVLLDEPTSGLSPLLSERIESLVREIAQRSRVAVLLVEHNLQVVRRLCDRVVLLGKGEVVAEGEPAEVLEAEWRHVFLER